MSLYKIDGHIFSVNELITWIAGFITLHDKGKLQNKQLPPDIVILLSETSDKKELSDSILKYLMDNEDFMPVLINIVQLGFTEIAIEKNL